MTSCLKILDFYLFFGINKNNPEKIQYIQKMQ